MFTAVSCLQLDHVKEINISSKVPIKHFVSLHDSMTTTYIDIPQTVTASRSKKNQESFEKPQLTKANSEETNL